jgi:hypothetical protein
VHLLFFFFHHQAIANLPATDYPVAVMTLIDPEIDNWLDKLEL